MVNQDTELVWLESGMRYSPGEYFFRNIYRYMRFKYPSKMFETVSFEIDDSGIPYWVAPTITYRIGWWDGKDINGAILVNAVTGESHYYTKDEVPTWIDQLYTSDLIMEQLDDQREVPERLHQLHLRAEECAQDHIRLQLSGDR